LPWRSAIRSLLVVGLVVQWMLLVGTSEGLLGDDLANLVAFNGGFGWGLLIAFVEVALILWALRLRQPPLLQQLPSERI